MDDAWIVGLHYAYIVGRTGRAACVKMKDNEAEKQQE